MKDIAEQMPFNGRMFADCMAFARLDEEEEEVKIVKKDGHVTTLPHSATDVNLGIERRWHRGHHEAGKNIYILLLNGYVFSCCRLSTCTHTSSGRQV